MFNLTFVRLALPPFKLDLTSSTWSWLASSHQPQQHASRILRVPLPTSTCARPPTKLCHLDPPVPATCSVRPLASKANAARRQTALTWPVAHKQLHISRLAARRAIPTYTTPFARLKPTYTHHAARNRPIQACSTCRRLRSHRDAIRDGDVVQICHRRRFWTPNMGSRPLIQGILSVVLRAVRTVRCLTFSGGT